jgi:hypothetical protein
MTMHGPMNIKFTRYSYQILRKLEFSRKDFEIYSDIKFKVNISSEDRVTSCRRTDVAKLRIAFAILRTRPKRAVLRRNPLQVVESFSFTRELLCCFYFWKENPSLSKEKKETFSTLTFKINSSGKQDKKKCKPFNCLFERRNLVLCVMTQSDLFIYYKSFLNVLPWRDFVSSSVLTHVEHWKPLNKFWLILISAVNYTRHVH